jgi:protein gp37
MSETTIQWTGTPLPDGTMAPGFTFNPWLGCAKVSAGCSRCYAEHDTPVRVHRGKGLELWGVNAARHVTSDANWKKPRTWDRAAKAADVRYKVFCASLADVFEDRLDLVALRDRLFALIDATPNLDWLLLTKRPENMRRLAPESWAKAWPSNVWAGCTVEDQERAEERIPHLCQVPAVVRFLSMEPLLWPVAIGLLGIAPKDWGYGYKPIGELIDWVIVGGESGSKARPFDLRWARAILDEARAARVPMFMKQLGAQPFFSLEPSGNFRTNEATGKRQFEMTGERLMLRDGHGGDMSEWPEDLRVRQFPEARIGR